MTTAASQYYATRFTPDARRGRVWTHLVRYFARYVPATADVLELGAGYCYFINAVTARRRVAVDLGAQVRECAGPGVDAVEADVLAYLPTVPDGSFDVVFASNFLEHFEWPQLAQMVGHLRRILRPGGRLLLMQPNFRLQPGRYFDDYTHRAVFSDVSLADWLEANGFRVTTCEPRFLPLTVKSRAGGLAFLVPWYLRSPWRPLAGQMFVVAEPVVAAPR